MNQDNPTEHRSIEEALHRLFRMMRRSSGHGPRRTHRYNRLLSLIASHDGVNARELAELMDIRPSSLTEMLNRMEEDGLVRRERDEADQRIVILRIEPAGRKQLERPREADRFSGLLTDDEARRFIALCEKLSDGLEATSTGDERSLHHRHGHGRRGGHGGRGGHGDRPPSDAGAPGSEDA